MKHFVQAFIHSRIMYGAFYHPITRTQLQSLERLNNEARRVITGLPKYTPLPALKSCSALGDIADLMSMHEVTQVTRVQSRMQGERPCLKSGMTYLIFLCYRTYPPLGSKYKLQTPNLCRKTWETNIQQGGRPTPEATRNTRRRYAVEATPIAPVK
ncbi:hypothetical protein HPB50_027745 [Hyalomma asiaticum]|nr:hypothetical protein HPB50_027745 [Hyalomma asiaticum]